MRTETGPPAPSASSSLGELLGRFPVLRPPLSTAGAAVTIVLRNGPSGAETLLIERATNPEDPASGEVALPGGRVEERDGSLLTTALRELREEVGLGPADLTGPTRFVGSVPAPRFGLHVGVFVAQLSETGAPPTIGSPTEVAHVFWLPSGTLAESRLVTRETVRGPTRVLATVHNGHLVWGFTRRVLRDFFGLPPEDSAEGPVLPEPRVRRSETGPTGEPG